MVNKIATRIQSRLSRKGIKITLGDIKTAYSQMVADDQNPTNEEIDAITDYFLDQASKLAPVSTEQTEEELTPVATDHNQSDDSENVDNLYTSVDTTPQAEETETSVCIGEDFGNISTPAQIELETLEVAEEVGAIATLSERRYANAEGIALQETSELVASTAENMGIVLNLEEVTAIAENFDYASENIDQDIAEIESAITSFVQHKASLSRQRIAKMVSGVRETVNRLDAENTQLLSDGLRGINEDIKSGSQKFKSSVRQALKAFALPPSKAG